MSSDDVGACEILEGSQVKRAIINEIKLITFLNVFL